MRWTTEYLDIRKVDVTYSKDKKSFDANAVLRSTYHAAFLERGLASLPEQTAAAEVCLLLQHVHVQMQCRCSADAVQMQCTNLSTDYTYQVEEAEAQLGAGRARRAAPDAAPATDAAPPAVTLHTHDLTVGSGDAQIYPSRVVTTSLDGASVNLGKHGGVAALLKKEVPHVKAVHGVAHVVELAWNDAVSGEVLLEEMFATNQLAYVHWAGSAKKKLSHNSVCEALDEKDHELTSAHGIRWREATHRSSLNMLKSWHTRTTDLLEEASVEIGLKLTPLSPPEAFIGTTFKKKTAGGIYGSGDLTFTLKVTEHLGKTADSVNTYSAKYMRVGGRMCHGEIEQFNQGDLLAYLLDESGKRERLMETKAGVLLERLTRYSYVFALAYWVDITAEGKVVSKLFQSDGLLLSDITGGVEDSVAAIERLGTTPGAFTQGLAKDFDSANKTLYGHELSDVAEGKLVYEAMRSSATKSVVKHMNERFHTLLFDAVLKAACIFEHLRWPSYATDKLALESHGEEELNTLLDHYKVLFGYFGGDAAKARREWRKLKFFVGRSEPLTNLKYTELYHRLFDQKGNKFVCDGEGTTTDRLDDHSFYNILLIVAIVFTYAVDTSICERGFALMNNLKTARRSRMRDALLRTLMTICTLGKEWADPSKIPVDKIAEEWRSQSSKGRAAPKFFIYIIHKYVQIKTFSYQKNRVENKRGRVLI